MQADVLSKIRIDRQEEKGWKEFRKENELNWK